MPTIVGPTTEGLVKDLIMVKTNIGGLFFDAFLRVDHTSKLHITEHPVQTGAAVSDHAYLEPAELVIEIGMSDAMKERIPGQFAGGWSRSVTAYQALKELQALRIPMTVLTRLGLYKNMMIESIVAPDDYRTLYGLRATITMREILIAQVQTVKVSTKPHITDSTNRGEVQPQPIDESIMSQIKNGQITQALDKLFGPLLR